MYQCSIIGNNVYINAALNGVLVTLMQYIKGGTVYINFLRLRQIVNNAALKVHSYWKY